MPTRAVRDLAQDRALLDNARRRTPPYAGARPTTDGHQECNVITSNNLSSIFVLDQDEALRFYTEVLGLEVAADIDFGMMRWLTVRVPGTDHEILLERPGPPAHDEATAEIIRDLVSKGAGGGWLAFTTEDVHAMFDKVVAAGVDVTQEPMDQPYGTDFAFRDPSGNAIRVGRLNR
jgi:predicted enzyme related to lactoylglutathione lyase